MRVERYDGNAATWNEIVAASPYGHVLQSYEWGQVRAALGQDVVRVVLRDNERIAGAAQILLHNLPGGVGRYAYIPKGPVIDYGSAESAAALGALIELAREERFITLKLDPELVATDTAAAMFLDVGFRQARPIQPPCTRWLPVDSPDDELLAGMKQKTRYNIRVAQRRGVIVRPAEGDAELSAWYRVFTDTAARDGFYIRGEGFYRTIVNTLGPSGLATLLLAYLGGDLLGGILLLGLGRLAVYMFGATANHGRQHMPSYLLQWEAMRWAREQGACVYDMWGISERDDDSLAGVSRFKAGFGGQTVRYLGTFDYVCAPVRHQLIDRVAIPLLSQARRRMRPRAQRPSTAPTGAA